MKRSAELSRQFAAFSTNFPIILTLSASTFISACNSGGGSNDAPPRQDVDTSDVTSNRRLSRLNYDLDNNGTTDGVREFSYDSAGRVIEETYRYTSDGTPDTDFRSFSIDAPAFDRSTSYSYNSAGLLAVSTTTDPGSRIEMVYNYGADSLVDQLTMQTFNSGGGLIDESSFNLSYNAGALASWEFRLGDSTLLQSDTITYNAMRQASSDLLTQAFGGSQELSEYVYTATGKIGNIHNTIPASGSSFFRDELYQYDPSDRVSARIFTGSSADQNYRWNLSYSSGTEVATQEIDLSSNGSIEASVTAEWEDGPCRAVFMWAPRAEPNFVAAASIPYMPGSGYAVIPVCGGN